jgi:hypothetical protein
MSYDVEINIMGLVSDDVSTYVASSYEEALSMIVKDGKEFAEFPLDNSQRELIDLCSNLHRDALSSSEEIQDLVDESLESNLLQFLEENFIPENMSFQNKRGY